MIWGLTTETFTLVHVLISLVAIGAGLGVVYGWLAGKRLEGWNALFLATTILTSVTGFGFPIEKIQPPHIFGIVSLVLLAAAVAARYPFRLAGPWRATYVVTAAISLYLNAFVGVVQAFLKIPALKSLAPTQKEPPFAAAQLALLALFIALTVLALKRSRPPETTERTPS